MENPKKVACWGIDRPFMFCALFGTLSVIGLLDVGASEGIGGGSMYMGLYAASSVYWGGPGVVTNDVVVAVETEAVPVPAGFSVVCPRGP